MFRRKLIVIKIDTTGLDGEAAMNVATKISDEFKLSWWDRIWYKVIVMPTYERDCSSIMVL